MNKDNFPSLMETLLFLVGLFLLPGCQPAEEAAEVAAPALANDSLAGSWIITVNIEEGGGAGLAFSSLMSFAEDGILIESSQGDNGDCPVRSNGHGVWRKREDGAYVITFKQIETNCDRSLNAWVTASLAGTLDESADQLSGTVQGKAVGADGTTQFSNSGSFVGERIQIEPME